MGFVDPVFHGRTAYRTWSCSQGALVTARKPCYAPPAWHHERAAGT